MSESPERPSEPATPTQPKPYWLYQLTAWVVIVAGLTFIASTIFFTGAYVAKGGSWHGHHHCHHHGHSMTKMGPEQQRGPGPATPGPDRAGPGEAPASIAPAPGR